MASAGGSRGRGFDPLLMDDDGGMLAPPRNCQGQRGYHGALNAEGGKRWIDVRTRTSCYTAARFLYAHCRKCDGDWAHRARICASTCRGRR